MQARKQNQAGERACWDVARDRWSQPSPSHHFFDNAVSGTHCKTQDWYAESPFNRGHFNGLEAPAMLGRDASIRAYCNSNAIDARGYKSTHEQHPCDNSNVNILQLRPLSRSAAAGKVEWNLCRNLEWQLCAARGKLPKQGSGAVLFANEPRGLWLDGSHGSPRMGSCSGFNANGHCNPATDFANV